MPPTKRKPLSEILALTPTLPPNAPSVSVSSDGSAFPNNGSGSGGWAYVIRVKGSDKVFRASGYMPQATNNTAELTAVLEALKALPVPCHVDVRTDSSYVIGCLLTWVDKWIARGWVTTSGTPVMNQELIVEGLKLTQERHSVAFSWIKGHANDPDNEACDQMATNARLQRAVELDRQGLAATLGVSP